MSEFSKGGLTLRENIFVIFCAIVLVPVLAADRVLRAVEARRNRRRGIPGF